MSRLLKTPIFPPPSVWGKESLQGNTASLQKGPPSILLSPETTNLENPLHPAGNAEAKRACPSIPTGTGCCFLSAPGTLDSFSSSTSQSNK